MTLARIFILLSFLLSDQCFATVTFNVQGKVYSFEQPVRLANVLSLVSDKPAYWASSAVYKLNDPGPEKLRAEVLQTLSDLIRQQTKNSKGYHELTALYQEIGSWQLMRRMNILVDYDQARLNNQRNPAFQHGDYYIKLQPRRTEIHLFGLISESQQQLDYEQSSTVSDYLNATARSTQAHRDYAYVIEPDGTLIRTGIAYWNRQYYKPMPNSIIFVPLQTSLLFDNIDELNSNIAQLLKHRM
ncbi:capsule biosynthesis GfcC family protein [Alteromonas gilva]|uniref:Capsule biosynthesis GfcC family protein n=1 Tax=Alteromonas gilva TaxID=2987522 RepID=A0ABT5L631_9ALTE|nr:capsule biosynthesis GfcC family protein [Alteromonas gilva]MDC8831831.1 capsule biosynthesis GfcC family protein [Alteromonas gilva]